MGMSLALPYLAVIKSIPRADVVNYAPHVYEPATSFTRWVRRGDKKVLPLSGNSHLEALSALDARFSQLEQENAQVKEVIEALSGLDTRISQLEQENAQIKDDIGKAADIISSLAEQNARLVGAVDNLQTRAGYLVVVSGVSEV